MDAKGAKFAAGMAVLAFVLAGRAKLTLVSLKTGVRFTYSIRAHQTEPAIWFVSLLVGASNENDYKFLGTIFGRSDGAFRYAHGQKSTIGAEAPSALAFAWAWPFLARGELPSTLEAWHEGRCGKCGRLLTVPESIASGIGPTCAGRAAA